MDSAKKDGRYARVYDQLVELLKKSNDTTAQMCTVSSVLKHKFEYFFWCGFSIAIGFGVIEHGYEMKSARFCC